MHNYLPLKKLHIINYLGIIIVQTRGGDQHNDSNYDNHQSLKENSVTYGGVEVSLAVHGQVEASLRSLNCHYPQTHRNQVELCCGMKSEIFMLRVID